MNQAMVNMGGGLEGYYQLTVRDTITGKITKQTAPFKNLITNSGLDYLFIGYNGPFGTHPTLAGAYVGTGNTAPAVTDTQLTTYLASNNSSTTSTSPMAGWTYVAAAGSVPPYWSSTGSWTFPAGAATGILAEVGIGVPITASPYYILQSHALIVDNVGNPTTITVLSTEQLTLTYTLNLYWNVTTQTGTINISGVTYAISWLPTNLPGTNQGPNQTVAATFSGNYTLTGYNGSLGTPLTSPLGTTGTNNNTGSIAAYTPGSYYQQVTYTCDVNHLNFTGGITVLVVNDGYHQFQIGFTPAIPKDNTYTFTFICNLSLARYP